MKLSIDDPRLTAYALGEITDEQELASIREAVENSKELQEAVHGIREMGDLLSNEFIADSVPELSEFEKAKLEQEPVKVRSKVVVLRNKLISWPFLLAASAAAVVTLVLLPQALLLYQDDPALDDMTSIVEFKPVAVQGRVDSESITISNVEGDAQTQMSIQPNPSSPPPPMPEALVRLDNFDQPRVEEEVYELSLFSKPTGKDSGYVASNTLAGSRLAKKDRSKEVVFGMSGVIIADDFPKFNTENYDMRKSVV